MTQYSLPECFEEVHIHFRIQMSCLSNELTLTLSSKNLWSENKRRSCMLKCFLKHEIDKEGVVCMCMYIYVHISVQFRCSVMSNSLRPHGQQHARPPCPSVTPRVYSNSCPLTWWCHPTISYSVTPFFSCPQSIEINISQHGDKSPNYELWGSRVLQF